MEKKDENKNEKRVKEKRISVLLYQVKMDFERRIEIENIRRTVLNGQSR